MGNRLKQCAWCRREYDNLGPVGEPLSQISPDASHGVCLDCVRSLLDQEAERRRYREAHRLLDESQAIVQAWRQHHAL